MNKITLLGTFALRNLKSNVTLSILMVSAIGVLISASMTTVMLFTAMAPQRRPLPQQSAPLVAVQKEGWAATGDEWSVEPNKICNGKSAGLIRLLL